MQKSLAIADDRHLGMPKPLDQLSEIDVERKKCISKVMTHVLKYLTYKFASQKFEWLLPVIFSKSTDPLWPDPGASIKRHVEVEIYGKTVRMTSSMIIHKIVACSLAYPKLFIISPNIRIEKEERAKSGMHLYEFSQLDFEVRNATSKEIRNLVEEIVCGLMNSLKRYLARELIYLGRYYDLKIPKRPFRVYDREDLEKDYGKNWENKVIFESPDPIWVTNIPREFYDFEDLEKGKWDNYDLLMPTYGEVLSGSRREWQFFKIAKKMGRDNIAKENYELLLKLAKEEKLKPSSGAGIGIERMVGWIVGTEHVGETQPFPKIPGTVYDL